MVTITEFIPEEYGTLVVIGDTHLGDESFTKKSEEKLRGYINWVKENPNSRVFLNGDIFNVATRVSKTSPFSKHQRFPDEMEFAVELFKPIANQIIGATDGNHEFRLIDFVNYSLVNELCQRLSTKERKVIYCMEACLLFLKVGRPAKHGSPIRWRDNPNRTRQTYSGYIHHTNGGGSTVGGKINRVDKLRQIVAGCDFYAGSHNHMEGTVKTKIYIPNIQKCMATEVRQILVDCGSFLEYIGYPERLQCAPVDIGAPKIRFDSRHHDIHVSL